MPFDSISTFAESVPSAIKSTPGNTLAAIGIQPVPDDVVTAHKRQMVDAFRAKSRYNADLVDSGRAFWEERTLLQLRYGDCAQHSRNFEYLANQLRAAPGILMTPDTRPPPRAIIDIARTVHGAITGAAFSIEYFYDDPILIVRYADTCGESHRACLGIWNQGKVVAIAAQPPRADWWSRLFGSSRRRAVTA
jgi:hypothetical protein